MIQGEQKSTAFEVRRPFLFEVLLTAGRLAERCGVKPPSLAPEDILAAARKRTRLQDFGPHEFEEPLRLILEDYATDPNRGLAGRIAARARTVTRLCQRLWIQDDLRRNPETPSIPIARPVFILGFPRTGTTLLQRLLSQDPANRVTYMWEMQQPALPEKFADRQPDVRLARAKRRVAWVRRLVPQVMSLHPINAENPEECSALLANTLVSPAFAFSGPRYREWLFGLSRERIADAYRHYKLQLQILTRRETCERWVLKSPAHLFAMDSLLDVFPDACLVHMHRDPLKVVPSGCSLATALDRLLNDKSDARVVSDRYLELSRETIRRAMQARDEIPAERVVDMQYEELMANPVAAVQKIYGHFGIPFRDEFADVMRTWLVNNAQDKHGRHHYALDDFGLTTERINEVFQPYIKRFNIPCPA